METASDDGPSRFTSDNANAGGEDDDPQVSLLLARGREVQRAGLGDDGKADVGAAIHDALARVGYEWEI